MKVQMATYVKVFIGVMAVITLFMAMGQAFVTEDADLPIQIEPQRLAVELGGVGQFVCTGQFNYSGAVLWLYQDGTLVQTHGDNIVTDNNGTLDIMNATLEDSEDFSCVTTDYLFRKTVTLKVFIMPSYFEEGVIILAINGALLVLFLTCMTSAKIRERKERQKAKQLVHANASNP